MMLWLRSLLFLAFGFTSILVFAIFALLVFWAPQSFLWQIVVTYCRLALWGGEFFCGMKVVVEGKENLPDEPSVIMIKHTTTLETYGHVPMFPRTAWVLKREIIWMPIFGWVIGLLFRPIAIRRSARSTAVRQVISQGKEKLPAVIDSGASRLMPVGMAASTTALGMAPLVLDAFFISMAVTIIAGLVFASVLTMIFVPVLYAIFFNVKVNQ